MRSRLRGERIEHVLPFMRRSSFHADGDPFQLTLLPAGHVYGSAMALVEAEGASALYTGDFRLRGGLTAESCAPCQADTLIMETTFGRPEFCFPPAQEVWKDIINFCQEALMDGATPVLLGYSLGKSQELLSGVAAAGLPVMLDSSAQKIASIYTACGCALPAYEVFDPASARGKVLILPPQRKLEQFLEPVGAVRTAVCTGWAMDQGCRFRYGVDAAFPLSDHADYPELLELVREVAPRRVYSLHGYAADFARTLRRMGVDAHALSEPDQLELPLFGGMDTLPSVRRDCHE